MATTYFDLTLTGSLLTIEFYSLMDQLTFEHRNIKYFYYYFLDITQERLLTPFGLSWLRDQIFLIWWYDVAKTRDSIFKIRTFKLFKIFFAVKQRARKKIISLNLVIRKQKN